MKATHEALWSYIEAPVDTLSASPNQTDLGLSGCLMEDKNSCVRMRWESNCMPVVLPGFQSIVFILGENSTKSVLFFFLD